MIKQLPDLWGDPFFKDNVIRLNSRNIEQYEILKAGGGFIDGVLIISSTSL